MKNIFNLLFLVLVLISFSVGSCSKDDDTSSKPKTELLQAKKWKVKSFTISGIDVTNNFLDDCDKDDYAVFKTGGILELYPGSIKCDPSDPDVINDTWALSTDEKMLTLGTEVFTIVSITSTDMQLKIDAGGVDLIQNFQGF